MFQNALLDQTRDLLTACADRNITLSAAESCTGGLISALLTEIPGSSAVVRQCHVTYADKAKHAVLGVPTQMLKEHGAVSAEVARAMAEGAALVSGAELTVAVSGIAGPDGGTADKPVGTVHFATHYRGGTRHDCRNFGDIGRRKVRMATVEAAIAMLDRHLRDGP